MSLIVPLNLASKFIAGICEGRKCAC